MVHDFFVAAGGAEECAIEFANLLPDAQVYTSFFDVATFGDRLETRRIRTWPLSRIPGGRIGFRGLFPLYAAYFGHLRVDAELVVSSSIAFTKAVRTPDAADHIAYVYTPMRYAWDLDTYLATSTYPAIVRAAARLVRPAMQRWDVSTAQRPDVIVAISHAVRERIERSWRRDVHSVIYPPVPVDEIPLSTTDDGYFLVAARLIGYRRIDLAVLASTALGARLIVVGDGPERERLEAMAGPRVEFRGRVSRSELLGLMSGARAYLLPGVEDFGIAPVEAMAAGKPVVAMAAGGALETVVDGVTGVHCTEPTVEAFTDAMLRADRQSWDPPRIRAHAATFSSETFRRKWRELLRERGHGILLAPAYSGAGSNQAGIR